MSKAFDRECAIARAKHVEVVSGTQLKGWAIFSGCGGEDPTFVAFVSDISYAEAILKARDPDDPSTELVFDATMVPALASEMGIVCANDVGIKDHTELEEALGDLWVDRDTERAVIGHIGDGLDCGCAACVSQDPYL